MTARRRTSRAAAGRRTTGRARRRSESLIGHLIGMALVSFLVYAALDRFTPAADALAMWCSGLAAGLAALPAWTRMRHRVASTISPAPATRRSTR
ncbi:hypothetical protein Ssi03_76870 [Sphaerisporangium siamense]|uniref:Uncharacterized protein n=1 Tax=Sphaerisporangium siamense TaxID=795645 RepID=A0A7W7DIV9_9ACTN|nr:hypothetical protein [Sphaerisporangium siamense]MBB4706173.1 hypothetical protein [Sphaerisporangium siamense]GII89697.1 hypothetical protein Ssi03_76870 [Sphaerisporangium siamense]